MFFFFFSSRRRHTRSTRDWSSDVCSSDLVALTPDQVRELGLPEEPIKKGDKRAAAWEQAFGVKQTEIDALTTPKMVQRGVLRQMLDAAIAPYLDPTLTSRVKEAEGEWYAEAVNAVEEQIDEETREELREKAAA